MRDLVNNVHPVTAIAPAAAAADNTPFVSGWIDLKGFQSLTFIILLGALADADATFTTLVEHSDASDGTGAAAVGDAQLIGTEALASANFGDDGETRKIGYAGSKRYVRLTVTPAGNAGNAFVAAVALLGHPKDAPTANPPA